MDRWTRFGAAIGAKMAFIAPVCVACGVLLPQVFSPVEAVVPVLFAIMTFQGSLNNTFSQVKDVFRRPGRMIAILLVTMVAMPALARVTGGLLFGANPDIVCGIVLEYSVPVGVVSIMWVGMYEGNSALGLACVLVSTVLSPFTIPLGMQLLLGQTVHVDVVGMMRSMTVMIALPAIAGVAVNDATRGWGEERLSPVLSPACKVLLVLIITANSTEISDYMHNLTPELFGVIAFILVFATSGFLWGMLLARATDQPLPTLVTMCFDCGLRNISSGAVIAAAYFPGAAMFPVMMGTLFQQILAAAFGSAMNGVVSAEHGRARALVDRARRALAEKRE